MDSLIKETDPKFDAWSREQYRKSMDTILVYNPTDEDYVCYWDKFPNLIPAKNKDLGYGEGRMQVPRYIADKYMKEMKDLLINEKNQKTLTKELENRDKKGMPRLTPFEKQAIIDNTTSTNDEREIENIYSILFCGVVKEFGLYDLPQDSTDTKPDLRTAEEKVMERLNKKVTDFTTSPTTNDKNIKVDEVTVND